MSPGVCQSFVHNVHICISWSEVILFLHVSVGFLLALVDFTVDFSH